VQRDPAREFGLEVRMIIVPARGIIGHAHVIGRKSGNEQVCLA
jgi:hypothetical protein